MIKVYIAHPYGGKEENKAKVEKIIKDLIASDKRLSEEHLMGHAEYVYISPIHAFAFTDGTYLESINMCFALLDGCNAIRMCGDWENSRGCNMEYAYAKAKGMHIYL